MSLKSVMRNVKNTVLAYTDIEVAIREATSNDPWGVPTAQLAEIARATNEVEEYPYLFAMTWKRLNDFEHVLHVQKALILVDYLVRNGADRFVSDCKKRINDIARLMRYKHYDANKKEDAGTCRVKAKNLYELLKNDAKLAQERAKAQAIKDVKLSHVSSDGENTAARATAAPRAARPSASASASNASTASAAYAAAAGASASSAAENGADGGADGEKKKKKKKKAAEEGEGEGNGAAAAAVAAGAGAGTATSFDSFAASNDGTDPFASAVPAGGAAAAAAAAAAGEKKKTRKKGATSTAASADEPAPGASADIDLIAYANIQPVYPTSTTSAAAAVAGGFAAPQVEIDILTGMPANLEDMLVSDGTFSFDADPPLLDAVDEDEESASAGNGEPGAAGSKAKQPLDVWDLASSITNLDDINSTAKKAAPKKDEVSMGMMRSMQPFGSSGPSSVASMVSMASSSSSSSSSGARSSITAGGGFGAPAAGGFGGMGFGAPAAGAGAGAGAFGGGFGGAGGFGGVGGFGAPAATSSDPFASMGFAAPAPAKAFSPDMFDVKPARR